MDEAPEKTEGRQNEGRQPEKHGPPTKEQVDRAAAKSREADARGSRSGSRKNAGEKVTDLPEKPEKEDRREGGAGKTELSTRNRVDEAALARREGRETPSKTIRTARETVKVEQRTKTILSTRPWELNRLIPGNTPEKREKFGKLLRAARNLDKAE